MPSTNPHHYFFRFIAGTRLAFSDWKTHQLREQKGVRNIYPEDKAEMMVFDKRIKKYDFFHHYGLGFDIKIEGPNKEEAMGNAEELVLNFIGTLCFLGKYYVEPPQCVFSYKYPVGTDKKLEEYQALLIDDNLYQPNEGSLRPVNMGNLNFFLKKIINADVQLRSAIYFALHWFWKGVGAKDKRDRFINLWVALEILENHLKKLYGLPDTKRDYPRCEHCGAKSKLCPNCQKDFSYWANSGFTGYKKLEENISDKKVLKFNKLYSNRSSLVHSGGNLSVKDVDNSIFSTRVLINCAILSLFQFPNSISDGILMAQSPFRSAALPTRMEFNKASVKVKQVASVDDIDKQPSVEAEYTSYSFKIADGDLISNCAVRHKFNDVVAEVKGEKIVKVDSSQNVKEVWEGKK